VSGFAGIVRMEPTLETAEADRAAIARMAEAIAFRGPDAHQQVSQDGASFAFSLLTTGPAPQAAEQPVTLDGETFLLGEARVDGRNELIEKLEQHGAPIPAPATDEQLVLHFVSHFGIESLPDLDGDFSFVLWNARRRRLFAYRDLTGARPFFYSAGGDFLLFSNTLQATICVPYVSRQLDEEFLGDFLLGLPNYDPSRTVYREIRRLPPGHLLQLSESGFSVRRIGHMPVEDVLLLKHDREYLEEFRRLLSEALSDRLPQDDTTIMLSGGLDSTTLAALAVELRTKHSNAGALRLRAFSADSKPIFDDPEGHLAERFAATLNIPCQLLHSGDSLPFEGWDSSAELFPEPVSDPYFLLYVFYQREIACKTRVSLTGIGGDEVLRLRALPYLRFLREKRGVLFAAATLARYVVTSRKIPVLGAGIRSGILAVFRRRRDQQIFPTWLTPEFAARLNLSARWREMNVVVFSRHQFNPRAYEALNDLSVGSNLEGYDPTWVGRPIEHRTPFLDRRLCRFLLRIPLIPWAMDKHLLRVSQAGILPDRIRLRPKTPVLQDVLLLHATSGKWQPETSDPPALLRTMVNWPRLVDSLNGCMDESLYTHLRPLALSYWLKGIESRLSIQ
jgi:asparagine synthase (glutamine-hydrolysing)